MTLYVPTFCVTNPQDLNVAGLRRILKLVPQRSLIRVDLNGHDDYESVDPATLAGFDGLRYYEPSTRPKTRPGATLSYGNELPAEYVVLRGLQP